MRSGKTTAMSGQDGLTGVSYKLWEESVSEDHRGSSQITGALGSGAWHSLLIQSFQTQKPVEQRRYGADCGGVTYIRYGRVRAHETTDITSGAYPHIEDPGRDAHRHCTCVFRRKCHHFILHGGVECGGSDTPEDADEKNSPHAAGHRINQQHAQGKIGHHQSGEQIFVLKVVLREQHASGYTGKPEDNQNIGHQRIREKSYLFKERLYIAITYIVASGEQEHEQIQAHKRTVRKQRRQRRRRRLLLTRAYILLTFRTWCWSDKPSGHMSR